VLQGKHPVRERLLRAQRNGGVLYVSAVSVFELSRELARSPAEDHRQLLEAFLAGPAMVLALEETDARAAVFAEATLHGETRLLVASDFLIAGQALARGMTLVGIGPSPLDNVEGLRRENWGTL
jgi:tRNA(fMet)-specific endonuclease VapC